MRTAEIKGLGAKTCNFERAKLGHGSDTRPRPEERRHEATCLEGRSSGRHGAIWIVLRDARFAGSSGRGRRSRSGSAATLDVPDWHHRRAWGRDRRSPAVRRAQATPAHSGAGRTSQRPNSVVASYNASTLLFIASSEVCARAPGRRPRVWTSAFTETITFSDFPQSLDAPAPGDVARGREGELAEHREWAGRGLAANKAFIKAECARAAEIGIFGTSRS